MATTSPLSTTAGLVSASDLGVESLEQPSAARMLSRLSLGVCLAGVILLSAVAASSRASLVYDEGPYLAPVALLQQYGLSLRFLREYPEPAGLLHNVLHWTLAPLTGLTPPGVRLVNPVLLWMTIYVTFLTLRLLGSNQPLTTSLAMIGIPSIWNMSGMVLTEMPSLFLTAVAVYCLVRSRDAVRVGWSLALAGGICLGLAFLSRASVLVVLGALPCLALADWKRASGFAVGTLLVTAPVIAFWGGLVPPHSVVAVESSGFSFYNLALSFCYGATMMLILAPRWFSLQARWALPLVAAIVVVNSLTGSVEIPVMRSVVARLPGIFGVVVPRVAGSLMLALAALFSVCSLRNIYLRRHDRVWVFLCVAMLLLVAAPGKITHQFSSRYTGMASGMMVLASDPFAATAPWSAVGKVVGMLIGLSSLLSYYALAGHG